MIVTLILYNILLLILSPIAILVIIWSLIISDKSRHGMKQRIGFVAKDTLPHDGKRIWLHAVSVGETVAAKPIWQQMLTVLPTWHLIHSTTTDTGQAQARKAVGEHGHVIYFPFDFLPCVWLALRRVRPELIVLVETELWPNFLAVAKLLGCRVMVVNGRISDRSLKGAARFAPLYRWMTGNVDLFCMQSEEDAARIIRLGADPARVTVVGNSKFDQVVTDIPLGEQVLLRNALGLSREEPVLLAGSTHPGEEEILLRAFRQVKKNCPDARLVIAPRDIHRAQKIEEIIVAHGFTAACRTKITAEMPSPPDAVIILDTIGELARAYALCTAAFVGGSLVSVGGHNVLEPVALGKPAIFGPQMSNFRDISAIVQRTGVGFQITTAEGLAIQWQRFLTDQQSCHEIVTRAAKIFDEYAGASQRCAAAATQLVEDDRPLCQV
ncbi:MAG TPA: 3-deoxy-D-manno-octulosonic acid transferase [Armatimonadota bacterium]|nr:3-deoxy-D-manno-octulosonic acid transferase [Armatimonadota bacterium]